MSDPERPPLHEAARAGFGAGAEAYEQGRPSYPTGLGAHLRTVHGLPMGCQAVDVGAGTGKMTRLLLDAGFEVIALEPVAEMRQTLVRELPRAKLSAASAEDSGLPSASADLIVVAQAFHWFDATRALAEFSRVLRPGGGLSLVWNSRDARVPWVARLSQIVRWNQGSIPTYDRGDENWSQQVTASGAFEELAVGELRLDHELDRETLRARVASISYIAAASEASRAATLRDVDALVADFPQRFVLPYRTFVYDFRAR